MMAGFDYIRNHIRGSLKERSRGKEEKEKDTMVQGRQKQQDYDSKKKLSEAGEMLQRLEGGSIPESEGSL
jgi:hypothetical protein